MQGRRTVCLEDADGAVLCDARLHSFRAERYEGLSCVSSRTLQQQSVPPQLQQQANELSEVLKSIHDYTYRPPAEPLEEARLKVWYSRDLKMSGTGDSDHRIENDLWNQTILAALPDGVHGHKDEVEIFIGCHVFNEDALHLLKQ